MLGVRTAQRTHCVRIDATRDEVESSNCAIPYRTRHHAVTRMQDYCFFFFATFFLAVFFFATFFFVTFFFAAFLAIIFSIGEETETSRPYA